MSRSDIHGKKKKFTEELRAKAGGVVTIRSALNRKKKSEEARGKSREETINTNATFFEGREERGE